MPRRCSSISYNEQSKEAEQILQWGNSYEIFGYEYEPKEGGVEEPKPTPGWKAWYDKGKGVMLLVGDHSLEEQ